MSVKEILQVPNQILSSKCSEITVFDDTLQTKISDIVETLNNAKDPEGAGLAAPQIGILERICAVRKYAKVEGEVDHVNIKTFVLVNPVITKFSKDKNIKWEGCLSIKDKYIKVERSNKIKVDYYDSKGIKQHINASGFFARVIQHEVDHLDGILMTDCGVGPILTEKELDELHE